MWEKCKHNVTVLVLLKLGFSIVHMVLLVDIFNQFNTDKFYNLIIAMFCTVALLLDFFRFMVQSQTK